ncbi:MAG TPA: hypothetical protein VKR42_05600 [Ktedonobacteraceae bacterium]|nr:hypothetical protein [Ktedonobacteraceae bacterium]
MPPDEEQSATGRGQAVAPTMNEAGLSSIVGATACPRPAIILA